MTIAGISMAPLCARTAGNAIVEMQSALRNQKNHTHGMNIRPRAVAMSCAIQEGMRPHATKRLTDSHQHQKPGEETTKVRGRIAGTVHEIIGIRTSRADPVGKRRYDIGCDNDERQEIVPER